MLQRHYVQAFVLMIKELLKINSPGFPLELQSDSYEWLSEIGLKFPVMEKGALWENDLMLLFSWKTVAPSLTVNHRVRT